MNQRPIGNFTPTTTLSLELRTEIHCFLHCFTTSGFLRRFLDRCWQPVLLLNVLCFDNFILVWDVLSGDLADSLKAAGVQINYLNSPVARSLSLSFFLKSSLIVHDLLGMSADSHPIA